MTLKVLPNERNKATARWVARLESGQLGATEQGELDAWLAQSTRNRGALVRAQVILAAVEQASVQQAAGKRAYEGTIARRTFARRGLVLGCAAAAASTVGVAVGLALYEPIQNYRSERGEIRIIQLADGSKATLNTNTEISVRYSRSAREVFLEGGEAHFVVSKDEGRPFLVSMGDVVVRAVGTEFVVRKVGSEDAQVLVSEGAVDMFRLSSKDVAPLRVPANARAVALEAPIPSLRMADSPAGRELVERELAWRQGMISVEGKSLRQAAEEFARYTDIQIIVNDPAVADLTITGLFSAYQPFEFARAAAKVLNLKTREMPKAVLLYR